MTNIQGFKAAEMNATHLEHLMAAPMKARCKFCSWTAEGEAGDLLKRAKRHRERRHGIMNGHPSRNSSRHLHSFKAAFLTDTDREEIEAEIARRRRLHGIEEAA